MKTSSSSPRAGADTAAQARARATEADPRWQQVLRRDPAADGRFVFSVRSTGVYCRPTCTARRARPDNVAFHADPAAAEAAGFRACQRCRPGLASPRSRQAALVAELCRRIAAAPGALTLADLARISGLSPWHLQRSFRAHTGLTPHAYGVAVRAERLRQALPGAPSVTDAVHDAGYGSSTRFYAQSLHTLGMAPDSYRRGGREQRLRHAIAPCSLGLVLVAESSQGVCAIALGNDAAALEAELRTRFPLASLEAAPDTVGQHLAMVVALIEDPRHAPSLPLDVQGTTFQHRVWQALRAIPAGQRRSYAEIAAQLGMPKGARAVAAACAANPLAVLVPCHRVVRGSGDLAGYRWGVARKAALLAREAGEDLEAGDGTDGSVGKDGRDRRDGG